MKISIDLIVGFIRNMQPSGLNYFRKIKISLKQISLNHAIYNNYCGYVACDNKQASRGIPSPL